MECLFYLSVPESTGEHVSCLRRFSAPKKASSNKKRPRTVFSVLGRFQVFQKVTVRGASVKEEKVAVASVSAKINVLPSPGWYMP